ADVLPMTVTAEGEVSIGPEPIGHLAGFDFRVDPSARLSDKRLLLAAAERRLGDELDRRARSLIDTDDAAFALLVEDSGGPAVAGDAASSPGGRALCAMLADAGGMLPRKSALSAIAHLEQSDRQALHRLRVRLGPLDVFVPALLKPAAQQWRGALLAVKQGQT